jgi:zinc/manganese transport system substrate-binding protein
MVRTRSDRALVPNRGRNRVLAALTLWAAALSGPAQAQTVFACEPEWAALSRVLLPEAKLHVATHAGQDPHHIEARPALIAQMRHADLVVCTGAGLESGWLPVLQQRAGNPKAQEVFWASDHVVMIDPQPAAIGTPWAGDVHAEGNPHVHVDPRNLLLVAQALAERMQEVWPAKKSAIAERLRAFEQTWQARMTQWSHMAAPLRGQRVAAQHASFGYLWHWLGMTLVADLEPKPGMAPTPGHLQRLLDGLRAKPPAAVVVASYQDPRPGRWLSNQLGPQVPLLVLPATVHERADAQALGDWMDGLVRSLLPLVKP